MSDTPNPLEAHLARLERDAIDIAAAEPQTFDPRARWSRATAQAALTAVTFLEGRLKRGLITLDELDLDVQELHRAERILLLILDSETEQVIDDFDEEE